MKKEKEITVVTTVQLTKIVKVDTADEAKADKIAMVEVGKMIKKVYAAADDCKVLKTKVFPNLDD